MEHSTLKKLCGDDEGRRSFMRTTASIFYEEKNS
jgi:hypothetical protein